MYRKPPKNPLEETVATTPARDFEYSLERLQTSPGARKLELQRRRYEHGGGHCGNTGSPLPYAELHTASAFSFLDGASQPEDLVARAAALDLPAVALIDRNGVYGAPRFYKAAREAGIKALVGAEVVLASPLGGDAGLHSRGATRFGGNRPPGSRGPDSRETGGTSFSETRLTLLVGSRPDNGIGPVGRRASGFGDLGLLASLMGACSSCRIGFDPWLQSCPGLRQSPLHPAPP